jgi:hypothetical protein
VSRFWVLVLLASLPFTVLAQQNTLLDQRPFKGDAFTAPPPPLPPPGQEAAPPNDIAASPLPPADRAGDTPAMVPNPLDDATGKPAQGGGKQAQAQGTSQGTSQGTPQRGGWVQMATASLQALDKVNARAETLVVKVGDVAHFGSLDIGVRGCFVRTPDRPTDATAFVVVHDRHADSQVLNGQVFSGWMVRSAPYMSMMAHPIYDIRVAGCAP